MKLQLVTENGREVVRRIIEPPDFIRFAHVPARHAKRVLSDSLEETDALVATRKLVNGGGLS